MEIIDILCPATRGEWRSWLKENHEKKRSVWLTYYKKGSGKSGVSYEDAVEEAVCFGWIDSVARPIDDEKYVQRFTRRNKNSRWSESNIRRAEEMIGQGKMTPAGLLAYNERREYAGRALECYDGKNPVLPQDLQKALEGLEGALNNFNAFSPSYRRYSVLWINDAKRDVTRKKRIDEIARLAAENKKKQWARIPDSRRRLNLFAIYKDGYPVLRRLFVPHPDIRQQV